MPTTPRHDRGDDLSGDSGRGLVAGIVADCVRGRRDRGRALVRVTVDAPAWHEQIPVAEPSLVRRVIEPLVRRGLEAALQPEPGREFRNEPEVVVTSVDLGHSVEIEVADSGPPLSESVRFWLEGAVSVAADTIAADAGLALVAVRAAAARCQGRLRAVNCPEGGVAITLSLPGRRSCRAAA
jgi:sensor histidine kinase regulating citrate/malate metabolism